VNGQTREVADDAMLADLLASIDTPDFGVAVERNGTIVRRRNHATTKLEPDDRIELVTLVGGG
ncbi:MAG: sulfur carrier protein ThiS, partial [Planctomycetota bacterium]